jgi:CheY-like chemotaxis protein
MANPKIPPSAHDALPESVNSEASPRQSSSKAIDGTTGSGHLARRSNLVASRALRDLPSEILIVGDEAGAERLAATLRVLFGYQLAIRWACSLGDALDNLAERSPAHIFLNDIRRPPTDSMLTMSELRRAGYDGPIIVVTDDVTQACRARLIAAGVRDVIHKDDICSVRIAEAFDRATDRES